MSISEVCLYDPLHLIEDWWGEQLTPQLVDRMCRAPRPHLEAFEEYVRGASPLPLSDRSMDWTPTPLLIENSADTMRGRSSYHYLETALAMLLYAEQVAV